MTAITTGKILVTGANGYIAVWVVKKLLEKGFAVRGTVRSESKAPYLRELFKEYGDKLEIVVVEDITKEGAFDEAVKGVDAIAHTASPFHMRAVEPSELIDPAVRGTTGVLVSAQKYGSSVKRVIVLSSCAAVLNPDPNPRVWDETSWNEGSVRAVEEQGRDAAPAEKYRASKTLAERAAWDFVEKNKASIGFDLVVLNPPFVFGPVIHEVPEVEQLNSSMHDWWVAVKGRKDNVYLATVGSSWVDVRDLATAITLAFEKEEAAGERYIVSEGPYKWQDWVGLAHAVEPTLSPGNTAYDAETAVHFIRYNVTKSDKVFGITYFTKEQTTKDIIDNFKERKWIASE